MVPADPAAHILGVFKVGVCLPLLPTWQVLVSDRGWVRHLLPEFSGSQESWVSHLPSSLQLLTVLAIPGSCGPAAAQGGP